MPRNRVLITLPTDAYRRLAEMADSEERVIDQQASLLLKRLLADTVSPASDAVYRQVDPGQQADVEVNVLEHEADQAHPRSVVLGRDGGRS